MENITTLTEKLNHPDIKTRLESLEKLAEKIRFGEIIRPIPGQDVNNHIHTTFSFSPYSPSMAVWMACMAGLKTAGIMDHDSISGAREFIRAGQILDMATTIGIECRVDMSSTALNGRRINNPDQDSIAYIALHGVPHTQIDTVTDFFKPYIEKRNDRNKKMIERINTMLSDTGINLDFDRDIVPLSEYANGGSITERHLSRGLASKIISRFGRGERLVDFLRNTLRMRVSDKVSGYLNDAANPFYEYDLIGFIKSDLIGFFYIPASEECPSVDSVLSLSRRTGAVSAYAYLGDVADSVTGDKKAQTFEDSYLDELFDVIRALGFNAVTYMPSRNTPAQLGRLKKLCGRFGFFEISGEDINSPRQPFVSLAMRAPEFHNLSEATWALIGHEVSATESLSLGMFSPETLIKYPNLSDRIPAYAQVGLHAGKGAIIK